MLEGIAVMVGLDVSLIPRQAKGCVGDLNYEKVETCVGRQPGRENEHVFGNACRHDGNLGFSTSKTITGAFGHGHIKRGITDARRLVGDDRYSSIARLQAVESWGVPEVRALVEPTYFAGLRKVGVPEE